MKAWTQTKEFNQLKPSEQKRLIDLINTECDKKLNEECEKYFCTLQSIWIKMNVASMHRKGLCRNTILEVMAQWRSLYRQNHTQLKRGTQQDWLDGMMDEVFGDKSVIDDYIETLKQI